MVKNSTAEITISLSDLLDLDAVQRLCESFTALTSMATAILDADGEILAASGWQRLCTEYHRRHPRTAELCRQSDTVLANRLARDKTYTAYQCRNGLYDVAVPIIIEDQHVGNLFTGQFFYEPPDERFFKEQAEKYGFDTEDYLRAVRQVPVFSPARVEQAMDFLIHLTGSIAASGLDRKRLLELNRDLEKRIEIRTAEIRAEKTFSESLIGSLPGIMYVVDRLGHLRKWNTNLETVSGYSKEELEKIDPLDLFISSDDRTRLSQAMDQAFHQGRVVVEAALSMKSGRRLPYLLTGYSFIDDRLEYLVGVGIDISVRKQIEEENAALIDRLQDMLAQVRQLSGFLPICASCKKIRDDEGYWNQIESYIQKHSEAEFSHSICPGCAEKLYPGLDIRSLAKK